MDRDDFSPSWLFVARVTPLQPKVRYINNPQISHPSASRALDNVSKAFPTINPAALRSSHKRAPI
jgi:hypothetical protein